VNFGVGISGKFLPTMGFFAMPLYNVIFTEDENTTYVSLNVGVNF